MFELSVYAIDGRLVRRFDLTTTIQERGRVMVGRAADCDIRIKHESVSRHHLSVEPDFDAPDGYIVRDLGSTHGSLINGVRIAEAAIKPGLRVRLGPATLQFDGVGSTAGRLSAVGSTTVHAA